MGPNDTVERQAGALLSIETALSTSSTPSLFQQATRAVRSSRWLADARYRKHKTTKSYF
jgi:hypothetical protein